MNRREAVAALPLVPFAAARTKTIHYTQQVCWSLETHQLRDKG